MSTLQHKLSSVEKLAKVTFVLEESDWHDHATETMWAKPMADRLYTLRSVPFYVYGVSFGDLLITETEDGKKLFRHVHKRGGHSTYRIFLVSEKSEREFEGAWKSLERLGCTYERATDYLIAVDVPPEADIYESYALLEKGLSEGIWDFEEGHCGHRQ